MHQREKVIRHGLASQAQAVVLFGASLSHQDPEDLAQSNICISSAGVNLFGVKLHEFEMLFVCFCWCLRDGGFKVFGLQ